MTRINDRLLVQLAEDVVVFVDESTGAEVTVPAADLGTVANVLDYFREVCDR